MALADSATNRASSPPVSSSSPSPPRDALDIPSESHEDNDVSAPGDTAARPKTKRGSRGKFTEEQDLVLLYAITRYAPYAAEHGDIGKTWEDVASSASASLQLPFTGRACSDRFKALKKWYQTWKEGSEFRSGSGEPETEKMRLLEEITTLEADGKLAAMNKKFTKEKTEKAKSSTGDKLMETAEQRLSDRSEATKSKERGSTKKRQRDEALELIEKQLEHEATGEGSPT